MKALLTTLLGLLIAGGTVFLLFDIKIEPKFNNVIIFGSNNTVNSAIDSRSSPPLPQPTVQAQITPLPVVAPKEKSSINDEPANSTTTKTEQASIPYTKAPITKTSPKYRTVSNNLYGSYQNTDNDYQDTADSDENSCACPDNGISIRSSTRIKDSNDTNDRVFQNPRPTTTHFSRSEQRQETVINGVRTVRRTVTITNNGETKTYVYNY